MHGDADAGRGGTRGGDPARVQSGCGRVGALAQHGGRLCPGGVLGALRRLRRPEGRTDLSRDRGKLRTTLHHNLFENVVERAPRVRFGKVDAYNNHLVVPGSAYSYSLGIGIESQLVAEKNAFTLADGVQAGEILKKWKDAPVTTACNFVNGRQVDLLAAHNAQFPGEILRADAGWTPTLRTRVDVPQAVPALVDHRAGAGRLR